MKLKMHVRMAARVTFVVLLSAFLLVACADNTSPDADPTAPASAPDAGASQEETTAAPADQGGSSDAAADAGYPGVAGVESGYPGPDTAVAGGAGYPAPEAPEGLQADPPNPERTLPESEQGLGSIGGVLIRELEGQGFLPVIPKDLFLGEVLLDSEGRQALIAQHDESHQAQLFPTGVFVFSNVPPGEYGLVIDIGVSQFLLTNPDGSELLVTVEPGSAIDLGQVWVTIPGD